jgi:4-alpha-glucanotransferase
VKAPGVELFDALLKGNPSLPLLAEDLGIITPEVEALRDRFNLPGMRVLQFGFGSEPGNPHTPCNFVPHCFAYTGTHDNDTTANWYRLLPAAGKRRLKAYAPGLDWEGHPVEAMIRLLMSSTAGQAIIPVQDLLGLGRNARMNTPGKAQHNWEWRLNDFKNCLKPLAKLSEICSVYERRAN